MNEILLIVDLQPNFSPPEWVITRVQRLAGLMPSVATVIRHNEAIVPFDRQLNWVPNEDDESIVKADRVFIKYGYLPPSELMDYLATCKPERVLVCGIQAETCVLAAGFALFDAGLNPTLIGDAVIGSSLDKSGRKGIELWEHHFGQIIHDHQTILDQYSSSNQADTF
ncbi:cysteine hydrolase family protein [Flexibacterium corallicola]|uniref:cysteine hydrolase family protein n=1 Tax=Flexibacterium corallicola TaxID=3037259 RepID=UPI00286EBCB9|nr:isochorismatase family protein [Pseudovibrio sp. M1P-2-3]